MASTVSTPGFDPSSLAQRLKSLSTTPLPPQESVASPLNHYRKEKLASPDRSFVYATPAPGQARGNKADTTWNHSPSNATSSHFPEFAHSVVTPVKDGGSDEQDRRIAQLEERLASMDELLSTAIRQRDAAEKKLQESGLRHYKAMTDLEREREDARHRNLQLESEVRRLKRMLQEQAGDDSDESSHTTKSDKSNSRPPFSSAVGSNSVRLKKKTSVKVVTPKVSAARSDLSSRPAFSGTVSNGMSRRLGALRADPEAVLRIPEDLRGEADSYASGRTLPVPLVHLDLRRLT